jgi:hypothetical protein
MSDYRRYLRLVGSLAYDATLFDRCIALLVKIIVSGNVDKDQDEGRRIFASLFPIYFSGTHATVEQRLSVIKSLIISEDPKERSLGLAGLTAALESSHFGPGWDFEFGARSRDYGWWPRTPEEIKNWFSKALSLVEEIACSERPTAQEVSDLVANKFRGLWTLAAMYGDLERIFRRITESRFWPQGWIAVRQTIHFDSSGLTPEVAARLASLEVELRPKDLLEKVRSIVLSEAVLHVGTDSTVDGTGDIQKPWDQVEKVAQDLGRAVASDQEALAALRVELVTANRGQLWSFGRGLAEGTEQPITIWKQLVAALTAANANMQNVQVFGGFLNALSPKDPGLVSSLLDDAVDDGVIGPWYPFLQTSVGIEGVDRILRSLEVGKARIYMYRALVGGGVTNNLSGDDFNRLLRRIALEPGGLEIALEILSMRISFASHQSTPAQLIDIGSELLGKLSFKGSNRNDDYRIGIIAKKCLVGEQGAAAVLKICRNLKQAVSNSETYPFYHAELLQHLLELQPLAVLEGLCGNNEADLRLGLSILDQNSRLRHNSLNAVPEPDLLSWCDQLPEIRYPAVATAVTAFQPSSETGRLRLTSMAHKLLDKAPDRLEVLRNFLSQLSPAESLSILDEMLASSDPALVGSLTNERTRLAQIVQAQKQTEVWTAKQLKIDADERFE